MTKKYLLVFSISLLFTITQAQLLFKLNGDSVQTYAYSGGDEFGGNTLDEKYWLNGLGWTRVLMSQDLAFSPKNVNLKDGLIRFTATKEDSIYTLGPWEIDSNLVKKGEIAFKDNKFLTKYSAGCIISKQKLHYGIYELRFKVEEGKGIWPAFWFFGGNKNEEIDAFELKCERNHKVHVDTHCPTGCDRAYKDKFSLNRNWGGWLPLSGYLHKGFNIMALEWNKDEVIWFVNGNPLAYFKGSFPNPMNLYLNSSVAKDGGPFKPGPDTTTVWPNTYYVDYFRIWQLIPFNGEIVLTGNHLTQSDLFESTYDIKPLKKQGITRKKKAFDNLGGLVFLTVDMNNRLTIRVSGKMTGNNSGASLLIGTKEIELNDFKKEMYVDLPLYEKSITLRIKNNTVTYQKEILLRR